MIYFCFSLFLNALQGQKSLGWLVFGYLNLSSSFLCDVPLEKQYGKKWVKGFMEDKIHFLPGFRILGLEATNVIPIVYVV